MLKALYLLFWGKSTFRIKGLLLEGDGFLLLCKRVKQGHFVWLPNSNDLRQLRPEQFKWLMQGFSTFVFSHPF